jgi:hypothetical protein
VGPPRRVRFELSDQDVGTRLVLTHTRVVDPAGPDFAAGWHRHLDTLSALTAGTEPSPDRLSWEQLYQHYR